MHALEVHTGPENGRLLYACNNCDKRYRHERDLKTHKERLCPTIGLKKTAVQQALVRTALNLLKQKWIDSYSVSKSSLHILDTPFLSYMWTDPKTL